MEPKMLACLSCGKEQAQTQFQAHVHPEGEKKVGTEFVLMSYPHCIGCKGNEVWR